MDKKKLILTIITFILFTLVFLLTFLLFNKYVLRKNFETSILSFANLNEKPVFTINKILLFSSCDAKNKNASASNFTIENLYQYTDMAIFIDTHTEEKNLSNTFKNVTLENIKITDPPQLGNTELYFKSINNFAKSDILDENKIEEKLDFTITSLDEADLSTPVLYNNLANPITISYVNSNIKTDYTLTDTSVPITYDGSLLKTCNVNLSDITTKLSFDINITNNLDQKFKCTIYVDIPLENEEKSIYDGNITLKKDTNFIFYRYE